MLCTGNFLIFRKTFFVVFDCRVGVLGVDSFIAKHTNTQPNTLFFEKTEEGKTKLLFDNGTSTTSARGFHWFSEFALTPRKKKCFIFVPFLLLTIFSSLPLAVQCISVTLSWIWILKALENSQILSLRTHNHVNDTNLDFPIDYKSGESLGALVCLFSAPRVLQSN